MHNIQQQRPLILNLTNHVTMQWVANGLLSLGASPLMIMDQRELADVISLSQAMVINIGTLDTAFIERAHRALSFAKAHNLPVIFDPVGAGASQLRTQASCELLDQGGVTCIKGNASEIAALTHATQTTRGVDSTLASQQALVSAQQLANDYNVAVVISGKEDYIVDSHRTEINNYGHQRLTQITGSGCLLTAVIAAFVAVSDDVFMAARAATQFYTRCADYAAQHAQGPGDFAVRFMNALSLPEDIVCHAY